MAASEMDRAPAYRVNLTKKPGKYYVVADDENAYRGNCWREGWTPQREILDVQRVSEHPVEKALQFQNLSDACDSSRSPLWLLTYTALSHAHAAGLARKAFAQAQQLAFDTVAADFFAD